jgi:hypothetical protein
VGSARRGAVQSGAEHVVRPKAEGRRRSAATSGPSPIVSPRITGSIGRSARISAPHDEEPTHFITVDLEVFSRRSLKALVAALGEKVILLHAGRLGNRYHASMEVADVGGGVTYSGDDRPTAEQEIRALLDLVDGLPAAARQLWKTADARVFDIGVQAGFHPHSHALKLSRRTIRRLADAQATVGVTTYAAMTRVDEKKSTENGSTSGMRSMCNPTWSELHWRYFAILRKAKDKAVRNNVAEILIEAAGLRGLTAAQFVDDGRGAGTSSEIQSEELGPWACSPGPSLRPSARGLRPTPYLSGALAAEAANAPGARLGDAAPG